MIRCILPSLIVLAPDRNEPRNGRLSFCHIANFILSSGDSSRCRQNYFSVSTLYLIDAPNLTDGTPQFLSVFEQTPHIRPAHWAMPLRPADTL